MDNVQCICGHRPAKGEWVADHMVYEKHFPVCSCAALYMNRAALQAHQHVSGHIGSASTDKTLLLCACGRCFSLDQLKRLLFHCTTQQHPFYIRHPCATPVHITVHRPVLALPPAPSPTESLPCDRREKTFPDQLALQTHKQARSTTTCKKCHRTFLDMQGLLQHHEAEALKTCKHCHQPCSTFQALIQHLRSSSRGCERAVPQLRSLLTYSCEPCDRGFPNAAALQMHQLKKHGGQSCPPSNWIPHTTILNDVYYRPPDSTSGVASNTDWLWSSRNDAGHGESRIGPPVVTSLAPKAPAKQLDHQDQLERQSRKRENESLQRSSLSPQSKRARMLSDTGSQNNVSTAMHSNPSMTSQRPLTIDLCSPEPEPNHKPCHSPTRCRADSSLDRSEPIISESADSKEQQPDGLPKWFDWAGTKALGQSKASHVPNSMTPDINIAAPNPLLETPAPRSVLNDQRWSSPPSCSTAAAGQSWMLTWAGKNRSFASINGSADPVVAVRKFAFACGAVPFGKDANGASHNVLLKVDSKDKLATVPAFSYTKASAPRDRETESGSEDGEIRC